LGDQGEGEDVYAASSDDGIAVHVVVSVDGVFAEAVVVSFEAGGL
jgi:hypothetical protein